MTEEPITSSFAQPRISPEALIRLGSVIKMWQRDHSAIFLDLPWTASAPFIHATKPAKAKFSRDIETPQGLLVASGEQSFCELGHRGYLEGSGLFIAWTPCFRDEPFFDEMHHFGFLKAELFQWLEASDGALRHDFFLNDKSKQHARAQTLFLAEKAGRIFNELIKQNAPNAPWCTLSEVVGEDLETHDFCQWDVLCGGHELGSYGVRAHPTLDKPYLYGTAIAEPRFSRVIDLFR